MKLSPGTLGLISCYSLPIGAIKNHPLKSYNIITLTDQYSLIMWIELIPSVTFFHIKHSLMKALLVFYHRYNIKFTEAIIVNENKFHDIYAKFNLNSFEKLLKHLSINYTSPLIKTLKIVKMTEKFYTNFEKEVLNEITINTLAELKHFIRDYNLYYNEYRKHEDLHRKTPLKHLNEYFQN